MKEAIFYEKLEGGKVRCTLCPRRCILKPGQRGLCGGRVNIDGKLYLETRGKTTGIAVDPIEKKPLFHFYPGHCALSLGTAGCNLICKFCQNYFIARRELGKKYLEPVEPEEIVKLARIYDCPVIAYTYNEPTVRIERAYDIAKEARKYGIKNVLVTNGFMTEEAAEWASKRVDAANIDIKGPKELYMKLTGNPFGPEPIMKTAEIFKERGVRIELTHLTIPMRNDKPERMKSLARRIIDNLGPETPLHITRFYPAYKMRDVGPTPISTMEELAEVARNEGLYFVYLGNIPGHPLENTYCPHCGKLLIKRYGFVVTEVNLEKRGDKRVCKECGHEIPIIGEIRKTPRYFF